MESSGKLAPTGRQLQLLMAHSTITWENCTDICDFTFPTITSKNTILQGQKIRIGEEKTHGKYCKPDASLY